MALQTRYTAMHVNIFTPCDSPGSVLTGADAEQFRVDFHRPTLLITKCIADRRSSRTSWCSPTGPRQNQKTFYVGYLLLSLFGLLHNLAFVSVQWLPRRFSWLSDSQVDPDRLTNRAIIGGNVSLVKTKRNQFHPTPGTPVGFGGPHLQGLAAMYRPVSTR